LQAMSLMCAKSPDAARANVGMGGDPDRHHGRPGAWLLPTCEDSRKRPLDPTGIA
jgi:hypothetical protein